MRRLACLDRRGRMLLQREEAVGQCVELLLQAIDRLPLLGELSRQLLDYLLLLGGANFQRRHPVGRRDHGGASVMRCRSKLTMVSAFVESSAKVCRWNGDGRHDTVLTKR